MGYYEQVEEAAAAVRSRVPHAPVLAVVLGSGLGDFAHTLNDKVAIPYRQLPNWPVSTVPGHEGTLFVGTVAGKVVAALSGRCHAYEGHDMQAVTFAVRVMALLGVKHLILTSAVGGINTALKPGQFMMIDDHINLQGRNPLIGPNDARFGVRFPDMSEVYSKRLRAIADEVGRSQLSVTVPHGVLATLLGPSYETPAEIRYLRTIGADAVGMSLAPEAIAARHSGLEVLGISCVTNAAAGVLPQPLSHEEVTETANRVRVLFIQLLTGVIQRA